MTRFLLLFLTCAVASAQSAAPTPLTAPAVKVGAVTSDSLIAVPSAPLVFEVADTVRVQPARPELRLQPGHTTGNLTFTLFSEVNALVTLTSDDPRLVIRGEPGVPLRLTAYDLHSVSAVALASHAGTITVTNTEGKVIARVPYRVAPSKTVNQGLSLTYVPRSERASFNYSLSGVNQSALDPQWNVGVGVNVDTSTGQVNGSVTVGVNW